MRRQRGRFRDGWNSGQYMAVGVAQGRDLCRVGSRQAVDEARVVAIGEGCAV
jgi:hypothetical protein